MLPDLESMSCVVYCFRSRVMESSSAMDDNLGPKGLTSSLLSHDELDWDRADLLPGLDRPGCSQTPTPRAWGGGARNLGE